MSDESIDASGFIDAPIDLVRELVERYVANGCDRGAMSQIVALVLSVLVERTLAAQLTHAGRVKIGDCILTLGQARDRIDSLRALPVF